jgi:predicted Rossmann fold nucleotide-binding protein DprA/Smf involved in DNA uptake
MARGTNGLLRDGAVPVTGPADVLDELFGAGVRHVPQTAEPPPAAPRDPVLRRVLDAAERHGLVSAIAANARISVAEARAALGRLESDGYLVRRALGGWERALGPPAAARDGPAYPGEP